MQILVEKGRFYLQSDDSKERQGDRTDMEKLYENQSYLQECGTTVTDSKTDGKKHLIALEASIFFPEEGGQYADTGWLIWKEKKVRLLDGQIKNGAVWYQTDTEIPAGETVRCQLDWDKRYMRMQQHTGEHILTGMIHNTFGYNNVGFHLSDDAPVTLDLDGVLTVEQAMEMETKANEAVYRNIPVCAEYPSKEELKSISYRSKIEIDGQVRLIVIDGVDICACCAPHAARTGEVGLIKIVSIQNYKGGTRLGILCGMRALLHYREQLTLMTSLANSLSTRPEQVETIVSGQKDELNQLRGRVAAMEEQMLLKDVQALPEGNNGCVFAAGTLSAGAMKNCYNTLVKKFPGYAGVFAGDEENGYRYNAGSASFDSRELAAKMREALGAKGGGSREMIQGKTSASRAEIEAFFENV